MLWILSIKSVHSSIIKEIHIYAVHLCNSLLLISCSNPNNKILSTPHKLFTLTLSPKLKTQGDKEKKPSVSQPQISEKHSVELYKLLTIKIKSSSEKLKEIDTLKKTTLLMILS